jgi:hypothetical protein
VLIILAWRSKHPRDPFAVEAGFLGNAACASCHPKEFKQHEATRHAATLRRVDRQSMGVNWPRTGPIGETGFAFYESGSEISLGQADNPKNSATLQYALGSERFAFTFIHMLENNSILELRQTYFPELHTWMTTPGQQSVSEGVLGMKYDEAIARHCLSCHATALPANSIKPDPRFFGVGCESCHGPGKEHVEAARRGERDLRMQKLASVSATKLNELCGRCHRKAEDLNPEQMEFTQRFTAYGLMKSRCFRESGGSISCSTCHDPHMNASTDHKHYEAVCLSCHAPASSFGPSNSARKPCPVNPRTGCIECHMPNRVIDKNVLPIEMSDHYIRVFKKKG